MSIIKVDYGTISGGGGASGTVTFSTIQEEITIQTHISGINDFCIYFPSSTYGAAVVCVWNGTNPTKYVGIFPEQTRCVSETVGTANYYYFNIKSVNTTTGEVTVVSPQLPTSYWGGGMTATWFAA